MRSSRLLPDQIQLVGRHTPVYPPIGFGERVRLNSGGEIGLVVDIPPDDKITVAWRESESTLPRACFKRYG
jgi:hypothetical protein